MAGMYPDNHELSIFGETVQWPGMGKDGKFTNGSFTDPIEKPSFIPAETLNLILDNLSELIKKLGGTPNNMSIDQLAALFTATSSAHKAIMRDSSGRAKVAAPQADDDIARKKEIDDAKAYADLKDTEYLTAAKSYADLKDNEKLAAAKSYTNEKIAAETKSRTAADAAGLSAAKQYTNELLIKIFQNGYIQWPGMPSPGSIFSFPGYRWSKVNYNGCFFRAEGYNALPFNGGEQGDAIRNIMGIFETYRLAGDIVHHDNSALYGELAPTAKTTPEFCGDRDNKRIRFDAARVVPTASENRPRNLTIVIWKLEKV